MKTESDDKPNEISWYEFRLIFSDASQKRNWGEENFHFIKKHIVPITSQFEILNFHVLNYFNPSERTDFIRFRVEVSQKELLSLLSKFDELKHNADIMDYQYEKWCPRGDVERRMEDVRQQLERIWRNSVENKIVDKNWKLIDCVDEKYIIDETDYNEFSKKAEAFKIFITRILGPWTKLFIEEMKLKPEDRWLLSLFIHLLLNSLAYSGPDGPSEEWLIRKVPPM